MKEMTLMQWDEDKVWKCNSFCMFIFFFYTFLDLENIKIKSKNTHTCINKNHLLYMQY